MPTIKEVARIYAHRTNLPLEYVEDVAHSLAAAGAWSDLTTGLTNLLLAVGSESTPRSAASNAEKYAALLDENNNSAGAFIQSIFESFLTVENTSPLPSAFDSIINIRVSEPSIDMLSADLFETLEDNASRGLLSIEGALMLASEKLFVAHKQDRKARWHEIPTGPFTLITGLFLYDVTSDIRFASKNATRAAA